MKKRLADTCKYYWQLTKDFCVHKILHADDPPHRLALGIALSMFVTFTPTIGFQMALVLLLAWLFGANKLVGVPLVWLSNPATLVPIYYPCYYVGRKILGLEGVDAAWWKKFSNPPLGWKPRVSHFWEMFMDVAAPLWLGCLVVGSVLGVLTYYISLFAIRNYRMRRWGQLMPPAIKDSHESKDDNSDDGSSGPSASSETGQPVIAASQVPGAADRTTNPKAFRSISASGSSPAA